MSLVVFDFDHTLFDGDSGTLLVRWLIKRHWWRIALACAIAPVAAPMIAFLPTRRYGISMFVWAGTLGTHDEASVNRLIDEYVVGNLASLKERLLPTALRVFNEHVSQGDTVLVATGAPTELARKLMREITHERIPVIGTVMGPVAGGMHAIQHCHNENKVTMIRAQGYNAPIDIAYTDSSADLPLLKAAVNPVVVNPKEGSVAKFRQALPSGTPVLWWGAEGRAGSRA